MSDRGNGRIWEEKLHKNEILSKRILDLAGLLETALVELKENETMLRESEERFRITFEKAAVGMAHVSPDGRWLRVNRKLLEIVGYEKEELLGLTFQDITYPDDLEVDLEYVRQMLEGKRETYSMEKRYVKKDGSIVWICLSVSLVRKPSGKPDYFISAMEDVTERKLAELVPVPLTELEMEVLGLVAEGRTNRRIAEELNYSEATVKLHVGRILAKLGAAKRTQAAKRAINTGLLPPRRRTKDPLSSPNGRKNAKRLENISRFGVPFGLFVG